MPPRPSPKKRPDTDLQAFERLYDAARNGDGETNAVAQLSQLVLARVKLQKKQYVMSRVYALYKRELGYLSSSSSKAQKSDCVQLGLATLECARSHRRIALPEDEIGITPLDRGKKSIRRDEVFKKFAESDRHPTAVRLRALELRDWQYYNPNTPHSVYRHNPFNYKSVKAVYQRVFHVNATDIGQQQRAFDLLKNAATEQLQSKHSSCIAADELLELLVYPMTQSKGNFLQNEALKTGYHYIVDGNSDLEWQAESLKKISKTMGAYRPMEAEWLADKSLLLEREVAQEKTYQGFMKGLEECVKKRDYPATIELFKDHEMDLKSQNKDLQQAQNRFAQTRPTPDVFQ